MTPFIARGWGFALTPVLDQCYHEAGSWQGCRGRAGSRGELSVSLTPGDLEAIRQLLKVVTDNQLSELTITLREGVSITIRADVVAPTAMASTGNGPAYLSSPQLPHSSSAAAIQLTGPVLSPYPIEAKPTVGNGAPVPSPMMGVFYDSPSPDEPAFVKPGDDVRVGQTIGLIEAMKVFSEVPSEIAGRVLEVAARNGDLVQLGQPLLYLEVG